MTYNEREQVRAEILVFLMRDCRPLWFAVIADRVQDLMNRRRGKFSSKPGGPYVLTRDVSAALQDLRKNGDIRFASTARTWSLS